MNSGSSAPIGRGGQSGLAASISAFTSTSRPWIQVVWSPVCLTTRQRTRSEQCSSAASVFDFRLVRRPPRGAVSAVMTSLAPQSLMRLASASGEKPAKTIEWIAPIRAQASIA
ncbi:hypothetical protein PARHAE_04004 [Paracoccus haematequi]|uniref:Uncharacterized protein n=1 Tax=Paracoccus haematequi TaxID=2491866 RepID=A0A3S4EUN3_9RHOB|nr:hypothetical protein PARHAE_04004 [Paracoccus haematequi]